MNIKEKYLNLWDLFEEEIKRSKKLQSNTLSGFAKYYEKHSEVNENNDFNKVYDRLKKMRKRKEELKNNPKRTIRNNSFVELENFYKTLNTQYFISELLPDEDIEHWFD